MNAFILSETYEDVKEILMETARNLHRTNHGEYDEMVSEGNVAYMKAFRTYVAEKGSFRNHVKAKMRYSIMDRIRKERDQAKHRGTFEEANCQSRRYFDLNKILREVSQDARAVLSIALDSDGGPEKKRCTIFRTLREWGWIPDRMQRVFQEIREVIHDPDYSTA